MARARCTLEVRGLDCPVEVAALRSALDGAPGVGTLGFDLIHGMMTVDYDPEATEPAALVRRIAARSGLKAEPGRLARGLRRLVVEERSMGLDGSPRAWPCWSGW